MVRIFPKKKCKKFLCTLAKLPENTVNTLFNLRKRVQESEHWIEFEALDSHPHARHLNSLVSGGLCSLKDKWVFRSLGLDPRQGETSDPDTIRQICAIHGVEKYAIDMLCNNGGICWN